MGVQLTTFMCPDCETTINEKNGPSYMEWGDAPGSEGSIAVLVVCPNKDCQRPFGVYSYTVAGA